jgi:hypothetical protein
MVPAERPGGDRARMRLRPWDHVEVETVCRACDDNEDRHDPRLDDTYTCVCGCRAWDPVQRIDRETHEVWLEQPLGAGWVAAQRLALQGGRVVVAELRVLPAERDWTGRPRPPGRWSVDERSGLAEPVPSGGVTARQLRTIRLGPRLHLGPRAAALVRALSTAWGPAAPGDAARPPMAPTPAQASEPPPKQRRGPQPWPKVRYARLAEAFVQALGRSGVDPVPAAGRRLGLTRTQARDALNRARRKGTARPQLLTRPSAPGLADGALTDECKRILRDWRARRTDTRTDTRRGATRPRPEHRQTKRRARR